MSGFEFEIYLYYVFKKLGYKVMITRRTMDFGADLIIVKNNIKTVIQAKRHETSVGISAIQEVLGSKGYYNADEALVITNNIFTKYARELANKNNVKLWDRGVLFNYLITEEEINNLKRKYPQEKYKKKIPLTNNKKRTFKKKKSFKENVDIIINSIFKK